MNKKILASLLAGVMAVSVCACGAGETTEETAAVETGAAIEYNVDECVKLGDYNGLEVTITGDYEVTDEDAEEYMSGLISYYGAYAKNDETEVKEDSVVNVDYTGYQDGEAFENGAATDQYIDIANSTYIEGFAENLIGHSVGETFREECTFPEDYGAENLAGQTVEFEYTINYIADPVTAENITDEVVQENFSFDTVEEFKENIKGYLENQAEDTRSTDIRNAIMDKLIEVCEVTFPEGLLESRLQQRIDQYTATYVTDGSTLEEYLQSYYGATVDEFTEQLESDLDRDLRVEMICQAIAEKEGIEFNQEEYDAFIQNILASGSYETEDDLYAAYGTDVESGKEYLQKMYVDNLALTVVEESAVVTEEPEAAEDTEAAEGTEETAEGETEETTEETAGEAAAETSAQ